MQKYKGQIVSLKDKLKCDHKHTWTHTEEVEEMQAQKVEGHENPKDSQRGTHHISKRMLCAGMLI